MSLSAAARWCSCWNWPTTWEMLCQWCDFFTTLVRKVFESMGKRTVFQRRLTMHSPPPPPSPPPKSWWCRSCEVWSLKEKKGFLTFSKRLEQVSNPDGVLVCLWLLCSQLYCYWQARDYVVVNTASNILKLAYECGKLTPRRHTWL